MAGNSSSWRDSVIEIPPPEKKSILEKFKRNQHAEIPNDYFLYSCLEHIRTETTKGRLPIEHGSPVLAAVRSENSEADPKDFAGLTSDSLTWYLANFPELFADGPMYFEHLMEFVDPLTRMVDEYVAIVEFCFGQKPAPLDTEEGKKHWQPFLRMFASKVTQRMGYVESYLDWFFGESKPEEIDLKSMPPVGRFAPPPGTKFLPDGKVKMPPRVSNYDRSQALLGNPRRPPPFGRTQNRGRPGGDRPGGGGDRPRGGGGDRPFPRNDKDRSEGRGPRRPMDQAPRGGSKERGHNPAEEAAAMDNVREAVSRMQANPELEFVLLNPTNSFFRRMQHKEVGDAGLYSKSVGEGKERALKLIRQAEADDADG